MGRMKPLIDTNVIVRFLIGDKNTKYKGLYKFFTLLEKGTIKVELKLVVLFQVLFVLKSFYKVHKKDIAEALLDLLKFKGITIREKKIIRQMLELWRDTSLEIVDCYLIASLQKNPGTTLYSYDHDFDRFSINRIEP